MVDSYIHHKSFSSCCQWRALAARYHNSCCQSFVGMRALEAETYIIVAGRSSMASACLIILEYSHSHGRRYLLVLPTTLTSPLARRIGTTDETYTHHC